MAAILTLLFKKDQDVSEFESHLGDMKDQDADISPLNKGSKLYCKQLHCKYVHAG